MPFAKGLDAIHPVELKDCNLAPLFLFWRSFFTGKKEWLLLFPGLKLKS